MNCNRIYNCLQVTRRFSKIVDRSAIRLLDDLLEGRFEFAHVFAGVAKQFLFEFVFRAQIAGRPSS